MFFVDKKNKILKTKYSKNKDENRKIKYFLIVAPLVMISLLTYGICVAADEFKKIDKVNDFLQGPRCMTENFESNNDDLLKSVDDFSISPNDITTFEGVECNRVIVGDLEKMLKDARSQGINFLVKTGYISKECQDAIFKNKVEQLKIENGYTQVKAESIARKFVQPGGRSEYQTGLVVDFCSNDAEYNDFSKTQEYRWLLKNSVSYGFILRYPSNKEGQTGTIFDPSVFRYVGTENAKKMRSLNMCFDEYSVYASNHNIK